MKWFRLYSEIIDDQKMMDLNDQQYRIMTYLMAYASELDKEGKIPFYPEKIAWRIRFPIEAVQDEIEKMKQLHILQDNSVGIEFVNWGKRQFTSDDATERWRKWYQGKKKKESNVGSNVESNVADTETDTDTEIYIPRGKIVNLYHGILPGLPTVKAWTDKRQKALKARWNEDPKRQDLEWWKKYFKYVKKSPFLMGKKEDFRADIDFLISPKLLNVIEGKYHQS